MCDTISDLKAGLALSAACPRSPFKECLGVPLVSLLLHLLLSSSLLSPLPLPFGGDLLLCQRLWQRATEPDVARLGRYGDLKGGQRHSNQRAQLRELWPFGPLSTMAVGDDSYDYCYVRLTLEFDSYEKGNLLLGLSDILVSRPYSWKPPGPYGPDYIVVPLELYSVGMLGRDGRSRTRWNTSSWVSEDRNARRHC